MRTHFMGIDPGASGGIAVIYDDGSVHAQKMPDTIADVWADIVIFKDSDFMGGSRVIAYLEKVGGYMGAEAGESSTRNKAAAHTMFTFGKGVGHLEMALFVAQIRYEEIPPQRWVKILGISPRKKTETKTEWKSRLKDFAQKLFPSVTVTNRTADALLIAEACRRSHVRST